MQFNTVSADILHWSRPHGARDQRHVFQPRIALCQRPCDKIVPVFTRASFYNKGIGRFMHQPFAFDFHLEHQLPNIRCQHHIAAAPQHKLGYLRPFWVTQQRLHVRF